MKKLYLIRICLVAVVVALSIAASLVNIHGAVNPSSGYFKIVNKGSGLVLDVRDGSAVPAASIQQWNQNNTDAQRWFLTSVGDNYWKIQAVHSGKYLNISGASMIRGGIAIQYPFQTGYTNDQWKFVPSNESGYYHIQNRNSNLYLGVAEGSTKRGADIVQWDFDGTPNQKWSFETTVPGKYLTTRYNQVQQISSHNSYDEDDGKPDIPDQLDWGIRSLEYDIHDGDTSGNWEVYHVGGHGKWVEHLDEGLIKLRNWSDKHPGHEVITLWLQVCDDWDSDNSTEQLDLMLRNYLGEDRIYKPYDWLNASVTNNLREAANSSYGWPKLEDLRRKFIIVLTGKDPAVADYLNDSPTPEGYRAWKSGKPTLWKYCFVAPENDPIGKANCPATHSWVNAVFFNVNIDEATGTVADLNDMHRVTRVWGEHGAIDCQGDWRKAFDNHAHHIATNFVTPHLFNSSDNKFSPALFDRYKQPFREINDSFTWTYWP